MASRPPIQCNRVKKRQNPAIQAAECSVGPVGGPRASTPSVSACRATSRGTPFQGVCRPCGSLRRAQRAGGEPRLRPLSRIQSCMGGRVCSLRCRSCLRRSAVEICCRTCSRVRTSQVSRVRRRGRSGGRSVSCSTLCSGWKTAIQRAEDAAPPRRGPRRPDPGATPSGPPGGSSPCRARPCDGHYQTSPATAADGSHVSVAGAPAQGDRGKPMWSLMNSTLISGAHDAVLVDTTVTFGQAGRLGRGPLRPSGPGQARLSGLSAPAESN
ncbi:hypothetical protein SHIRM173S_00685 [Streptomyces hirsutus]